MTYSFRTTSIRQQFFVLASAPVVLLSIIAVIPEPFILDASSDDDLLAAERSQIEFVVGQLQHADGDAEVGVITRTAGRTGMDLRILPWRDVVAATQVEYSPSDLRAQLMHALPESYAATAVKGVLQADTDALVVRLNEKWAFAKSFPPSFVEPWFPNAVIEFFSKVAILMLPVLLLVLYVGCMITSPLIRFADAAKNAGDGTEEPFPVEGAKEIRTLATSLNAMRRRVRQMADDRTRMLTAVSHDLRTPLTRLRMRAERSVEVNLRDAMLSDITTLTSMIDESLEYLSDTTATEPLRKVDLSSLLQTIATDFCDVGFTVRYEGPTRFGFLCKQRALVRAITNLIENATRFGTTVDVRLCENEKGEPLITVSDDGPGLQPHLHKTVLQPFFKDDEARTMNARTGFGLGLSIADDIVKSHGGTLCLHNLSPSGLQVTILLPKKQKLQKPARALAVSY